MTTFLLFFLPLSKQAVFDGKKAIRGGIPFVFRKLFNFDLNRPPTVYTLQHAIYLLWSTLKADILLLLFFLLSTVLCAVPAMSCQSSMMDDDRFRLTQQSPPSSSLTILGPAGQKRS